MTVLVCTREAMASDSLFVDEWVNYHSTKVVELPGALVGSAGDAALGNAFEKWQRGRSKPPRMKDGAEFEGLLLTADGIFKYGPDLIPVPVHEAYYAIGSGAAWAIAALDFGASIVEAVEYACQKDGHCDTPVHAVALPEGIHTPKEG
jgi:hypothetical protein